jgi:hypothetical protein
MQAHPDSLPLALESSRDTHAAAPEFAGAWPDAETSALLATVARRSHFARWDGGLDDERLRTQAFRVMALRPLQRLLRHAFRPARRTAAAVLKPLAVLALAAAALTLPIDQPRAQEALKMTAAEPRSERPADSVMLAKFGLDLSAIDACEDVELLWRVVRELVLPGRVSEATQHRILRRVWAIDPDIRSGSVVQSTVN